MKCSSKEGFLLVKKDLLFLVTSSMHLINQYHRSSSAKRSIKAEGA